MRCMMAVMLLLLLLGVAHLETAGAQNLVIDKNGQIVSVDSVVTRANEPGHGQTTGLSENAIVGVNELKAPEKALKELDQSDKALRGGDVRGSAAHIEKALAIAPDLALAHNALGSRYSQLGEYDKAIGEFEKALGLNRNYRLALDNIAVVLCLQHRYAEAEPVAKRALEIDPDAGSSQYLLGSIFVQEGRNDEQATTLLEKTKEKYARAWLFLAKVKAAHGDIEEATEEIREYLRSPSAMEKEKRIAQVWLVNLEQEAMEKNTKDGDPARAARGASQFANKQ